MTFFEMVINEMGKGNFSFPILIIGIVQLIVMVVNMVANLNVNKIKKNESERKKRQLRG